mgnify:FL=1
MRGYNESCGDDVRLSVKLTSDKRIEDVRFQGKGCAISQSSSSMMTDSLKGKTIEEAIEFVDSFKSMMKGEKKFPSEGDFEEISVLQGVLEFPVRVKCATLGWNTLRKGLEQWIQKSKEDSQTITREEE